jgi:transcription-repair coupling factor (superfamily II helicase)
MYLFKYNLNKYYITSCELKRGGQIYFLHNEIESIEKNRTNSSLRLTARTNQGISNGTLGNKYCINIIRLCFQEATS